LNWTAVFKEHLAIPLIITVFVILFPAYITPYFGAGFGQATIWIVTFVICVAGFWLGKKFVKSKVV